MKSKTKLLIITNKFFSPPNDGLKVRHYNLIKRLSGNFLIDIVYFGDEIFCNYDNTDFFNFNKLFNKSYCIDSLTKVPIPKHFFHTRIKNLIFPSIESMGDSTFSLEMKDLIRKLLTDVSNYNIVFLTDPFMLAYLPSSYRFSNNVVIDVVDCLSLWIKSFIRNETRFSNSILTFFNYLWACRWEQRFLSKFRNLILVSEVDRIALRRNCPKSDIHVISNGVDTNFYHPIRPNPNPYDLIFTGVMSYRPNHEAMVRFVKQIFPQIKNRFPYARLHIVGKDPLPDLYMVTKNSPGVIITGYVEDIRPFFNQSAIYVAPIISGAGIKNKILEAWAMEIPVVASPMSLSGLKAIPNHNLLVADGIEATVSSVSKLISAPHLSLEIARNGRLTAEKFYSWKSKADQLSDLFINISLKSYSAAIHT